jgi:hypothetical protein
MDQKGSCLSRRRVSNFSHFTSCTIGYPAGTATLRRLFWHTFFGEAKKVCSCRSTTGQQSHNNDRRTSSTEQQQTKTPRPSATSTCPCVRLKQQHPRYPPIKPKIHAFFIVSSSLRGHKSVPTLPGFKYSLNVEVRGSRSAAFACPTRLYC